MILGNVGYARNGVMYRLGLSGSRYASSTKISHICTHGPKRGREWEGNPQRPTPQDLILFSAPCSEFPLKY